MTKIMGNSHFSVMMRSFIGAQQGALAYTLSVAASACNGRVKWLQRRPSGPQTLKYLLSGPSQKRVHQPFLWALACIFHSSTDSGITCVS